ncbi:hypothetical protein BS47DRAFT_1336622 [Hydnum rufescens UP504]|uniref:Uncharacterized protein n=1 Tax=Hydnum rufescens UP504 TaxID=1448309 RepID=A0A9P6B9S0_9AGAM|nr:hypothetical protein BS47DRAFT_1336622 [Hydnum rufescens UP504]
MFRVCLGFLGPFVAFPVSLNTPRNLLLMPSLLQLQFDKYAFGIDIDDNDGINTFSELLPDFRRLYRWQF